MKIVSLIPSATEIVFALGLGDSLDGVTFECDYPPEAKSKAVVSGTALHADEPRTAKEIDDVLWDPRSDLGCLLLGSREIELCHSGDAAAFRRALVIFEQAVILSPDARAAYHFELAHAAGHANDREAVAVAT